MIQYSLFQICGYDSKCVPYRSKTDFIGLGIAEITVAEFTLMAIEVMVYGHVKRRIAAYFDHILKQMKVEH